jgi:hypothetical protein
MIGDVTSIAGAMRGSTSCHTAIHRSKNGISTLTRPMEKTRGFNAYQLLAKPDTTLVHYIGDSKLAVAFAHGNATKHVKEYTRTMPSVLGALKSDTTTSKANVV